MRLRRKELNETLKWKDGLCSWASRVDIVKMVTNTQSSTDSMQSLSKYQCHSSQKKTKSPKFQSKT